VKIYLVVTKSIVSLHPKQHTMENTTNVEIIDLNQVHGEKPYEFATHLELTPKAGFTPTPAKRFAPTKK